jgi:hypothetical protein
MSVASTKAAAQNGWEMITGIQHVFLDDAEWRFRGGPGVDFGLGYRWNDLGAARVQFTFARTSAYPPSALDDFGSPASTGLDDEAGFMVPQVNVEGLLQPTAFLGVLDPIVGLRLGWTYYNSGGINVGARLGARWRILADLALEAGWIVDEVYLLRQFRRHYWRGRHGVFLNVVSGWPL